MRRLLPGVVGLVAAGVVILLLESSRKPAAPADSSAGHPALPAFAGTESNSSPAPRQITGLTPPAAPVQPLSAMTPLTVSPPSTPAAAAPLVDGLPPATVLDNMRTAVRQYGLRFGGNPVGTNPEITKALNGGNPKQVKFIPPDSGLRINGQGELIDPWGTPFFFHQLSAMQMEIRSAGPDKVMWTDDDLVAR